MKFTKRIDGNVEFGNHIFDVDYARISTPLHIISTTGIDIEDVSLVSLINNETGDDIDFSRITLEIINHDNEWTTLSYDISSVEKRYQSKIKIVLLIKDKKGNEYTYSNDSKEMKELKDANSASVIKIFKGTREWEQLLDKQICSAIHSLVFTVLDIENIKNITIDSLKDMFTGEDIEYRNIVISTKISNDNTVKLFFVIYGIPKSCCDRFELSISITDENDKLHTRAYI